MYISFTADKSLMSQVAHLPVCLIESKNWCTSPPQQTRGSCHRWLSYLSAWFRRQELVYFSSTIDKRLMSQVAHFHVCLVQKAGAGVLLLHSRQEVHVTGELTYLSAWLRRQELVYCSSTADKRFMSQMAHLPVCLIEKAGAGVLLLHSRHEAHVTDGSVTCLSD